MLLNSEEKLRIIHTQYYLMIFLSYKMSLVQKQTIRLLWLLFHFGEYIIPLHI